MIVLSIFSMAGILLLILLIDSTSEQKVVDQCVTKVFPLDERLGALDDKRNDDHPSWDCYGVKRFAGLKYSYIGALESCLDLINHQDK